MKRKPAIPFRERMRPCNLCGEDFLPKSVFSRFCITCKKEEEILKYAEWLPDLTDGHVHHAPVRPTKSFRRRVLKELVA